LKKLFGKKVFFFNMGCCLRRNIITEVIFSTNVHDISEESNDSSLKFTTTPQFIWKSSKISNPISEGLEIARLFPYSPIGSPQQSYSDFPTISRLSISDLASRSVIPLPSITEVTSQLYFGSWESAKNEEDLRSRSITHTLSLIGPKHEIAGIQHKHTPMNDWGKTDLQNLIDNIWTFVEESQRPGNALFIHCMSGQNRSATIVIALMMKLYGESLDEAFKIVKYKRPIVQIHEQYAKQLSQIEKVLFGSNSVSKNWMEIRMADMSTGSVVFYGDSMISIGNLTSENMEERKPSRGEVNI